MTKTVLQHLICLWITFAAAMTYDEIEDRI